MIDPQRITSTEEAVTEEFVRFWHAELPAVVERWWKAIENVQRNRIRFASRWATEISVWAEYDRLAGSHPRRPSDEAARASFLRQRVDSATFLKNVAKFRSDAVAKVGTRDEEPHAQLPLGLDGDALWYSLRCDMYESWRAWLSELGMSSAAAEAGANAYFNPIDRAAWPSIAQFVRQYADREGPDRCAKMLHDTGMANMRVIAHLRMWFNLGLRDACDIVTRAGFH